MDYMYFRLELSQLLIGSFRSRQHAGCPMGAEHGKQDRLTVVLGHWPEGLKVKRDNVVCSKYRNVHHIPRSQGRHESTGAHIRRSIFVITMIESASKSTIRLSDFGGSSFYLDSMIAFLFSLYLRYYIHIYLCYTELNMLFLYTLYQCSFIFVLLTLYCVVYHELLLCTSIPCISCQYSAFVFILCGEILCIS